MCKECVISEHPDIERIYYEDVFCVIYPVSGGFECIYRWHKTPLKQHMVWIEQQIKIQAGKRYGQDWRAKLILVGHPKWEVRYNPNKRIKKKYKAESDKNITQRRTIE